MKYIIHYHAKERGIIFEEREKGGERVSGREQIHLSVAVDVAIEKHLRRGK